MQTSAAETEKCRRKHMQEVSYTITTEEMPYMESTNSSPYNHPARWRDLRLARYRKALILFIHCP
jgi:hypothetical protein